MASWVGALLGFSGLIIGFAVAAWLDGIGRDDLEQYNFRLEIENERLRRAIAPWKESNR